MKTRSSLIPALLTLCPLGLGGASILVVALSTVGCGPRVQPSGRPDLDAIPEADRRAAATKAELYEFKAKVKKRGANAAKQALPDLLGSLEGYEKLNLGQHKDVYRQIVEKLKALETLLAGSPAKPALDAAVDEIGALADKLPGNANPNPQVE